MDQAQVQEQGITLAELPELSEDDQDDDWESGLDPSDTESSDSRAGSKSSASSASISHGRKIKRRRRSSSRIYSNRGLVEGTGSVPRVVTRRLAKIMATGLDKAEVKSLRDRATPTFDSNTFALKCPVIDESIFIDFKQQKNASAESFEKHYLSLQYNIMDIGKPLLALRGAFENESVTVETLLELTELALDLWAVAFNQATHSRRRNVLKVNNAELLLLLNNSAHFSAEQLSYLFGDKFVTAMRTQAAHMSTMRNVKKVMSQPIRGNQGRGSQKQFEYSGGDESRTYWGEQPQRYAHKNIET